MEFKLSKVWRSNYLTIFSFSCFSFSLDTTSSKSNLAGSYKGRVRVIHKHKYKHSSKRCVSTRSYFYCSNFWLPASWDVHIKNANKKSPQNFVSIFNMDVPARVSQAVKNLSSKNKTLPLSEFLTKITEFHDFGTKFELDRIFSFFFHIWGAGQARTSPKPRF